MGKGRGEKRGKSDKATPRSRALSNSSTTTHNKQGGRFSYRRQGRRLIFVPLRGTQRGTLERGEEGGRGKAGPGARKGGHPPLPAFECSLLLWNSSGKRVFPRGLPGGTRHRLGPDGCGIPMASVDGRQSSAAARASLRERWACETLRWAGHSASSSRRQQSLRVYTALKPRASSHHAGQVLRCAEAALADAESGRDGIHGAMDAMAEVCEALMAAAGIVERLKGSRLVG